MVSFGVAVGLLAFGPLSAAIAQECAVTDLACTVGAVDDTVQSVDGSTAGIEDAVPQDVSQVVEDVKGTVDGLTGSGEEPPGGGGHDGSGGEGSGGGGGGHHGGASSGGDVRTPFLGDPNVLIREGGTRTLLSAVTAEPIRATGRAATTADAAKRIREAAAGIALSLLIVLAAVLVFTALQDRLDRREPRLALAPVTGDFVIFE